MGMILNQKLLIYSKGKPMARNMNYVYETFSTRIFRNVLLIDIVKVFTNLNSYIWVSSVESPQLSLLCWVYLLSILCFLDDHSRVVLQRTMQVRQRQSDYINANYIDVSIMHILMQSFCKLHLDWVIHLFLRQSLTKQNVFIVTS